MQQRDAFQRKHMGMAELGRITSCVGGYQIVYSLHLHYYRGAEGVGDVRLPELFLLFSVPCFFKQKVFVEVLGRGRQDCQEILYAYRINH